MPYRVGPPMSGADLNEQWCRCTGNNAAKRALEYNLYYCYRIIT